MTPESDRVIPLAQVTLDALAAHLAAFPAVEIEVEDRNDPPAARAAGLPPRTGLHVLWHLYASLLIPRGVGEDGAVPARPLLRGGHPRHLLAPVARR